MVIIATNHPHILPCCKASQDDQLASIGRLSTTGFGINIERSIHIDRSLSRNDVLGFGFVLRKRLKTIPGTSSARGVRKFPALNRQDAEMPTSLELEPITSEAQFYQILAEAQQRSEPVIIEWMATWCRKCIHLKPKLERLAAEFYPRVRFYSVNVNAVPQSLVDHAEVVKMPTIQLWKDGGKQAELIGGHNKAWLVVDDTREMIENSQ